METTTCPPAQESGSCRHFPVYAVPLLLLLLLVGWQGWMTLTLFGSEAPWEEVVSDEPVLSGKHAANLYLGLLGAQARLASGSDCCLDPAFDAGYPRTPIFNGSRLAELFMLCGGGFYRPEAYKIGLVVVSLLVPIFLFTAARAVLAGGFTAVLATALGLLVWWGKPAQDTFRAGDVELLVSGLAVLLQLALLVPYHYAPGFWCWLGVLLAGTLAWFAQPLLLPLFVPVWLVYYLSVGAKHPAATWHLALWGGLFGGVALNLFWLIDWVWFWWVRAPLSHATTLLPHRTLGHLWNAPLWGGPADRCMAVILIGSALVGIGIMNQSRQRPAARLLGLGAGGLLGLTFLGIAWEPLGRLGTSVLLPCGLFFAAVPAAYLWAQTQRGLCRLLGWPWITMLDACLLGAIAFLGRDQWPGLADRLTAAQPLSLGLSEAQQATVEKLVQYSGPAARILWEAASEAGDAPRWQAFLPLLTGRSFIGGLDPDGTIEHAKIGLLDHTLHGRHISTWKDEALEEYCRVYNVGWIAARSSAVIKRLQAWPGAARIADFDDGTPGLLFSVRNHVPTYTLRGHAQLVHADSHHLTLADVQPDKDGTIVLSMHYQRGMRALPGRVRIECENHGYDPIGFIRLRVAGPVARVTLTWRDR